MTVEDRVEIEELSLGSPFEKQLRVFVYTYLAGNNSLSWFTPVFHILSL